MELHTAGRRNPSIAFESRVHLGDDGNSLRRKGVCPPPHVLLVTETPAALETERWIAAISEFRENNPTCFIAVVISLPHLACEEVALRMRLYDVARISMFCSERDAAQTLDRALSLIATQISQRGELTCPYCGMYGLSEDALWAHCPLYHINLRNDLGVQCPLCRTTCDPKNYVGDPFQVHLRNAHGPPGRGVMDSEYRHRSEKLYAFALVVCLRESDGKMLLVHEFASVGLWLPGGRVDAHESLQAAATRECKEEAGIDIDLLGVLKVEYSPAPPNSNAVRMRVVFFARPRDENEHPKSLPDYESCGAIWANTDDVLGGKFRMRGREPMQWARYLREGGIVYPLSILSEEE